MTEMPAAGTMQQSPAEKAAQRFQLMREGKSKIMIRSIWLLLTRKCPLECRHCYFCGSPEGETMTPAQALQAVRNLPDDVESLGLSGGEPFTNLALLHEALKAMRDRNFPCLTNIDVQTTGFWARDKSQVKETLGTLIDLGVNSFNIYGYDKWHWERGLKKEQQDLLVAALQNDFGAQVPGKEEAIESFFIKNRITYRTNSIEKILPIGRGAWATTPEEQRLGQMVCRCKDFLDLNPNGYYYVVNFNGEVHNCIFLTSKPLGNIFERSLTGILETARQDKLIQIMDQGDIIKFAREYFNISQQEAEQEIKQKSCCLYHMELLDRYFHGRKDASVMYDVFRRERERWDRQQKPETK